MPLPIFQVNNEPTKEAMLLTTSVLSAISRTDTNAVTLLLAEYGPDAPIIRADRRTYDVDFALKKSGRECLLIIYGTQNAWQALDYIRTPLPEQSELFGGYVQRWAKDQFTSVQAALQNFIQANAGQIDVVKISGHSLGAAVAYLCGKAAKRAGIARVEVLNFGEPKCLGPSSTPEPDWHVNLWGTRPTATLLAFDPVPALPPSIITAGVRAVMPVGANGIVAVTPVQHGRQIFCQVEAGLNTNPPNGVRLVIADHATALALVNPANVNCHYVDTMYGPMAVNYFIRNGGNLTGRNVPTQMMPRNVQPQQDVPHERGFIEAISGFIEAISDETWIFYVGFTDSDYRLYRDWLLINAELLGTNRRPHNPNLVREFHWPMQINAAAPRWGDLEALGITLPPGVNRGQFLPRKGNPFRVLSYEQANHILQQLNAPQLFGRPGPIPPGAPPHPIGARILQLNAAMAAMQARAQGLNVVRTAAQLEMDLAAVRQAMPILQVVRGAAIPVAGTPLANAGQRGASWVDANSPTFVSFEHWVVDKMATQLGSKALARVWLYSGKIIGIGSLLLAATGGLPGIYNELVIITWTAWLVVPALSVPYAWIMRRWGNYIIAIGRYLLGDTVPRIGVAAFNTIRGAINIAANIGNVALRTIAETWAARAPAALQALLAANLGRGFITWAQLGQAWNGLLRGVSRLFDFFLLVDLYTALTDAFADANIRAAITRLTQISLANPVRDFLTARLFLERLRTITNNGQNVLPLTVRNEPLRPGEWQFGRNAQVHHDEIVNEMYASARNAVNRFLTRPSALSADNLLIQHHLAELLQVVGIGVNAQAGPADAQAAAQAALPQLGGPPVQPGRPAVQPGGAPQIFVNDYITPDDRRQLSNRVRNWYTPITGLHLVDEGTPRRRLIRDRALNYIAEAQYRSELYSRFEQWHLGTGSTAGLNAVLFEGSTHDIRVMPVSLWNSLSHYFNQFPRRTAGVTPTAAAINLTAADRTVLQQRLANWLASTPNETVRAPNTVFPVMVQQKTLANRLIRDLADHYIRTEASAQSFYTVLEDWRAGRGFFNGLRQQNVAISPIPQELFNTLSDYINRTHPNHRIRVAPVVVTPVTPPAVLPPPIIGGFNRPGGFNQGDLEIEILPPAPVVPNQFNRPGGYDSGNLEYIPGPVVPDTGALTDEQRAQLLAQRAAMDATNRGNEFDEMLRMGEFQPESLPLVRNVEDVRREIAETQRQIELRQATPEPPLASGGRRPRRDRTAALRSRLATLERRQAVLIRRIHALENRARQRLHRRTRIIRR